MKNKNYSCTHGCKYSAVAMVNELGFTITFKHDIPIGQLTKDGMDFSTSDILVDENAFRFLDENSMSSFTHCQHTKRIKLRDTRQCFEKSFVFIHICFFQSFFNNFKAETGHLKL